ncbi:MAG: ribonuclease P protein component [Candidatus Saccharimonadales bacterium]
MIKKANRFHGLGSLRYVYRTGRTVRGPLMVLKYAPNPRRDNFRAAVVVSRKVNKSAVVRNRIRRRIYEIIRTQNIAQAYDLVFIVFNDQVAAAPPKQLNKLIHQSLQKSGALTPANHAIVEK